MNGVTSSDQIIIRKLTGIIHANLENENFGVKELALAAGMSRSNLHWKLRAFLKKSVSQFINLKQEHYELAVDYYLKSDLSNACVKFELGLAYDGLGEWKKPG